MLNGAYELNFVVLDCSVVAWKRNSWSTNLLYVESYLRKSNFQISLF